ncbi:hypothetical protein SAMN02745116_00984 [Pilibacter termitis]|jgi:hypothetical protein|uniref:Uncharacterized protein n=1 Tax=Pilibacter termitis TaxID=263852 RepID=A0A1T4M7A5_9ENTE|nr:hypothetical protein [Pilibacter termitis]SJZ62873.1 hypothetical protein SAMN02745116_00984 [Pilibacter termitis]
MTKENYLEMYREDLLRNQARVTSVLLENGYYIQWKKVSIYIVYCLTISVACIYFSNLYPSLFAIFFSMLGILVGNFILVAIRLKIIYNYRKKIKESYSEFVEEHLKLATAISGSRKVVAEDEETFTIEGFVRIGKGKFEERKITLSKKQYLLKENSVNEDLLFTISMGYFSQRKRKRKAPLIHYRNKKDETFYEDRKA